MDFTVEIIEELTNIISVETSFFDTLEIQKDTIESDSTSLEIINNNYNEDISYTENIIDITTENISSATNYIDIELYQTYNLEINTNTSFLGNIHYTKIDGLADFIDSRIPNEFDCGTP